MPNSSSPTTKGKLPSSSTCLVYAPGPLVANAFETKCSIKNSPIGTIPVSECSRRKTKERPCPARSGATPSLTRTGVVVLADATTFLVSSGMKRELFIMLAREKGSQGSDRSAFQAASAAIPSRPQLQDIVLVLNCAEGKRQRSPSR